MDGVVVAFFVPTLIFVSLVLPIWLGLHYRSKQRNQSALTEDERSELELLLARAEQMAERVETLEAILDAETPGWRKRAGNE